MSQWISDNYQVKRVQHVDSKVSVTSKNKHNKFFIIKQTSLSVFFIIWREKCITILKTTIKTPRSFQKLF